MEDIASFETVDDIFPDGGETVKEASAVYVRVDPGQTARVAELMRKADFDGCLGGDLVWRLDPGGISDLKAGLRFFKDPGCSAEWSPPARAGAVGYEGLDRQELCLKYSVFDGTGGNILMRVSLTEDGGFDFKEARKLFAQVEEYGGVDMTESFIFLSADAGSRRREIAAEILNSVSVDVFTARGADGSAQVNLKVSTLAGDFIVRNTPLEAKFGVPRVSEKSVLPWVPGKIAAFVKKDLVKLVNQKLAGLDIKKFKGVAKKDFLSSLMDARAGEAAGMIEDSGLGKVYISLERDRFVERAELKKLGARKEGELWVLDESKVKDLKNEYTLYRDKNLSQRVVSEKQTETKSRGRGR